MRHIIVLSSDSSAARHPGNSPATFTNVLPGHLRPGAGSDGFYVRAVSLCMSNEPAEGETATEHRLGQVYLSEAEGRVVRGQSGVNYCLGQFELPAVRANDRFNAARRYVYREFINTTFHRLRTTPLHELSVSLVDGEGEPLVLSTSSFPTVLTLEIDDELVMPNQFHLVGFSREEDGDGAFANNQLNDFRVALPTEILLDETWEVAVTNVTFPKTLANSSISISCGGYTHYFNGTALFTVGQLLRETKAVFAQTPNVQVETQTPDPADTRTHELKFRNSGPDPIVLQISDGYLRQIGAREPNHGPVVVVLGPGQLYPQMVRREKKRVIGEPHPPAAFIYCNAVRPDVVGDRKAPLLQIVPLGKYLFTNAPTFFEPKNLTFRDTVGQKISALNFEIRTSSGEPYPVDVKDPTEAIAISLLFRRQE